MPKRQANKKQPVERPKNRQNVWILTEEERVFLALEMTLELSKSQVSSNDEKDGELEAILQLSLNPQEQINKEHRDFLSILTKVESTAQETKGAQKNHTQYQDLQLKELDEEEQMLIALRRSANENKFGELLKSEDSTNKGKENTPLSFQRITSKKKKQFNPLPVPALPPSPPKKNSIIPRIVVSQTGGYCPFRPIVIDGCNLAWAHGNNKNFSAQGIVTTAGFHVSHYDDLMIVDYASTMKGIVVSNDHFEDIIDHSKEFKQQIRYRLLPFTWVGNVLLFPQDPLGKGGPNLKNFLKY
ncbi:unnamed protein product [Lepeophtheirus salmonis]|uniref:(salmon louse) hypothetical protein n=1 Tax=Lepeophtheirus salmonis TaxID=72036 RepID=A0A7R8CG03_LEPSM|nr:unnamed protein product [Lepeophtheirus salmonis]CAF2754944.1 unnamed protein product [Lepeophtheirus salmonis]